MVSHLHNMIEKDRYRVYLGGGRVHTMPLHLRPMDTLLIKKGWALPNNPRRILHYDMYDNQCWVGIV